MSEGSYSREKVAKVAKGDLATCPVCLRSVAVKANGHMIRHGWSEQGRQVGQYGCGYQFDHCPGWGDRPLEETDADALKHIKGLRESEKEATERAASHRAGEAVNFYLRQIYGDDKIKKAKASGLEVDTRERFGHQRFNYFVKVTRGTVAESKFYPTAWPSFEEMAKHAALKCEGDAKVFASTAKRIESEVERFRAAEIKAKAAPQRKGVAVHARGQFKGKGQTVNLCRRWALQPVHGLTTDDHDEVTCKACRKILWFGPIPEAKPELTPSPSPVKLKAAKPKVKKVAKPKKASSGKLNEKEQAVLTALQAAPSSLTLAELAKSAFGPDTGGSDMTSWVRNSLRKLIRTGKAARASRGLYYAEKAAVAASA